MNYLVKNIEFSNLQKYLADYDNDNDVDINDVTAMNKAIKGSTYMLTDDIDEWGCSLADIIETEYEITIEEYIAENYVELANMDVIPEALRSVVNE